VQGWTWIILKALSKCVLGGGKKSRRNPKRITFLRNEDVSGCVANTRHWICSLNCHFSGLDIQLAQLPRVNGQE